MKTKDTRILRTRKQNLEKRLERKQWSEQPKPLLKVRNIHYEMAERVRAIECGGMVRDQLLAMEFRRFLNGLIRIPVQIITAGRRIVYRVLGYNQWVHTFMRTIDDVRRLQLG